MLEAGRDSYRRPARSAAGVTGELQHRISGKGEPGAPHSSRSNYLRRGTCGLPAGRCGTPLHLHRAVYNKHDQESLEMGHPTDTDNDTDIEFYFTLAAG